jgi:DNA-binding transcriptional regulator LsrR (DeoR family)
MTNATSRAQDDRSRRRADELDQLARQVARARLSVPVDDVTGARRHPTFDEVADHLHRAGVKGIASANDARRLYRRALERGLVSIRVVDERVRPERIGEDPDLSAQLSELGQRQLGRPDVWVRVFDVPDDESDAGDHVQEVLGWAAGSEWLRRDLGTGDRMALTGGRAVVAAVDALLQTRGLSGVRILAITGSSEQGTGRVAGASLDADSVVRRIVSESEPDQRPQDVRYVTLPLALRPDVMERDNPDGFLYRVGRHLSPDWWREHTPAFTLLGVARVSRTHSANHPLFVSQNPFLKRLIGELDDLLERHETASGLVIGEMSHQLWVAHPRKGALYRRAGELCEQINDRMVGPGLAAIGHSRKRVVLGGGRQKVEVIRSLLRGDTPCHPTNLYTDAGTARAILSES